MSVNGSRQDPLQAAIEQARQQEAQQQMLQQILQQAFHQPHRVVQITGPCMIGVVDNPTGGKLLMVAQPNGERWDVPINQALARSLMQSLAETDEDTQPATDAIEGHPA